MRSFKKTIALLLVLSLVVVLLATNVTAMAESQSYKKIVNLKTNRLVEPLNVDDQKPTFSWQMDSNIVGAAQSAYQIVVEKAQTPYSAAEKVWDTGKVLDGKATAIAYKGAKLLPTTQYKWYVTVWDERGQELPAASSTFETSFLDPTWNSWDGAEWIGPKELYLDAQSDTVYDIRASIKIEEDSTSASFIYSGGDWRLEDEYANMIRTGKENYHRFEIDISNLTPTGGQAQMKIYVVGMPAYGIAAQTTRVNGKLQENAPNIPDYIINIPTTLVNYDNCHEWIKLRWRTYTEMNRVTSEIMNASGVYTTFDNSRILNWLGGSLNNICYTNVGEIGFAVAQDQVARYKDIEVRTALGPDSGVLFGRTTGATYNIWRNKEGVLLAGSEIIVGSNTKDILTYADPTYGGMPLLRNEFATNTGKTVESAKLYITAGGIYEAYMNGGRIGSDEPYSDQSFMTADWFNPGSLEYREHMPYHVYDVKDLLKSGANAIGVQLAEGWWNGQQATNNSSQYSNNYYNLKNCLKTRIIVTYTDGTKDTYVTKADEWKYTNKGPVTFAGNFQGQRIDARKEAFVNGFSTVGYDDSQWAKSDKVVLRDIFQNPTVMTRYDEPSTVQEVITAKSVTKVKDSTNHYIYDMGENVTMLPYIKFNGTAGQDVKIQYSEVLYPNDNESLANAKWVDYDVNGMPNYENYRAAYAMIYYTAKDGANVIAPRLTFCGGRYFEVTGIDHPLPLEDVKGIIVSSAHTTATYESDNWMANRQFKNTQNSQKSNWITMPTDCPQRNERMGWTGDAQVFSRAAAYNADVYNFYRAWEYSVRDSQKLPNQKFGNEYTINGIASANQDYSIPVYIPYYGAIVDNGDGTTKSVQVGHIGTGFAGTSWDAALILIPWQMYRQYGETNLIEENMDAMYNYLVTFLYTNNRLSGTNFLTSKTGSLADWMSYYSTDAALINNGVYIYMLDVVAQMAKVIGDSTKAAELERIYDGALAEWTQRYIFTDKSSPYYGQTKTATNGRQNTQASYATPLVYNLIKDAELKAEAIKNMMGVTVDPTTVGINRPSGGWAPPYSITTGFSGTPNIAPALCDAGYSDVAYKMFECTEYASWFYPIVNGATSVWERWNSYVEGQGFPSGSSMNSFNHFSLGAISEWMTGYQLGITGIDSNPGYKEFILQPTIGGEDSSITDLKGSFDSNYGSIKSAWTTDGNGKMSTYSTTVPANSTATLYLPVANVATVDIPNAVEFVGMTTHNSETVAEFKLPSGAFDFTIAGTKVTAKIADGYVYQATANLGVKPAKAGVIVGEAAKVKLFGTFEKANIFEVAGTYTGSAVPTFTPATGVTIISKTIADNKISLILGTANVFLSGEKDLGEFAFATTAKGSIKVDLTVGAISGLLDTQDDESVYETDATLAPISATVNIYASTAEICDLNGDNKVSAADLSLAMKYYGATSSDTNWDKAQKCDVTGDGMVDMADLILILGNYTV